MSIARRHMRWRSTRGLLHRPSSGSTIVRRAEQHMTHEDTNNITKRTKRRILRALFSPMPRHSCTRIVCATLDCSLHTLCCASVTSPLTCGPRACTGLGFSEDGSGKHDSVEAPGQLLHTSQTYVWQHLDFFRPPSGAVHAYRDGVHLLLGVLPDRMQ